MAAQTAAPSRPSGTLLVANQASATATIIDLVSGGATHLEVGDGPHEAAISDDGTIGVVTIYGRQAPGNRLAVIDMARRQVSRTIDLGEYARPHDVEFLPGQRTSVVVTSEAMQSIVLVDVETGRVTGTAETRAQLSHMLGVTADGQRLFTANMGPGSISEISLPTLAFVREIAVAPRTEGVAVTPYGAEVWVGSNNEGTVSIVDTRTGTVTARLSGFDFPYRLAISADGRIAVVCDARIGKLHQIDIRSRKTMRVVEDLGSPRGIALSPDGGIAFVTLAAPGEAVVLDLGTGAVLQRVAVGASPDGIAYSPVVHPPVR